MRASGRGTSPWTGSRDSSIWARVFVHRLCTPPPSAVLLPASDAFSKYSKTRAASYFYLPPEGLQHGAWRDGGRLHVAHPRSHCTQA